MRRTNLTILFPLFAMLLLILDAKTALAGASDGIMLCLQTVIPSLFPFFVLSSMVTSGLRGQAFRFLSPLSRLLRIPAGSEHFWLVGLLGGYPVGARGLAEAKQDGTLGSANYRRMMAFCSNSGPAFIFGIGSHLFSNSLWCWRIWLIHIAASILVAVLTPGGEQDIIKARERRSQSLSASLEGAVRTMASVCGWVVLFRVIIAFCQRWFLWAMPQWAQIFLLGSLELANGCTALYTIPEETTRFVFFSMFLGFGGLCVTMQTRSVCNDLGMYIPGKVMHGLLSGLLAGMVISREMRVSSGVCMALLCAVYYFLTRTQQKRLDFRGGILYDKRKTIRGN